MNIAEQHQEEREEANRLTDELKPLLRGHTPIAIGITLMELVAIYFSGYTTAEARAAERENWVTHMDLLTDIFVDATKDLKPSDYKRHTH